jgi:hypothetical protein
MSWPPDTQVFATQTASHGFNHGCPPRSLNQSAQGCLIGATTDLEVFGRLAEEQGQVLITNEKEVKQDGQSFHLSKMVSVNAPVLDRERLLSQEVSVDGIPPAVSFARSRASQKQLDPPTRLTRTFNLSLHHRLQGANTRRRRVTPMQSIPPSIRGTRGTSTSLEIPLSLLLLTFSLFLFPITRASPYEISKRSRD